MLALYDCKKSAYLSADASSYGIGTIQDSSKRPSASRTLSGTEKGYAQIEKEALAVVWGCGKFHDYIVDLTVQCTPGKYLVIADALSRSQIEGSDDEELSDETTAYIQMVIATLPTTDKRLSEIWQAQQEDAVCIQLINFGQKGWPEKNALPTHYLQELEPGRVVWITDQIPYGRIKAKHAAPRFYLVETPRGIIRRSRFHLRPSSGQLKYDQNDTRRDLPDFSRDSSPLSLSDDMPGTPSLSSPTTLSTFSAPRSSEKFYKTRSGRTVRCPDRLDL
ncbi:hypothetical protein AVEN_17502-1 [Araneus ventricosus]|uniref:Reverse transcriptase/retrotransposon-derived protein RNase H-like domain-containing protein n=1 Tax=Araneus ventricosus TaxID=182803 RepID=A0A4Y2JEG9_ARAVE|nr:hypothetical protein AVEN_17502-1 [Araneus ventricosus]